MGSQCLCLGLLKANPERGIKKQKPVLEVIPENTRNGVKK